jgi:hypothetical protein
MGNEGYGVRFVGDDELPRDVDWTLLRFDGSFYFVVKRSRVCPRVLEEGWAAYRLMASRLVAT